MKRQLFPALISLLLVFALLFTGCSPVSVVDTTAPDADETEPSETSGGIETTANDTTANATVAPETTVAETTAEPEPEPVVSLGAHLKTVPYDPYTPSPYAAQSDKYTNRIIQKKNATAGAV
ncbi:MAG: hypothetical protein J6Z13_06755, partial [Clostridia bacterium]|nr:hypothetical protein [Clostridia bacterium]